MSWDAAVAAKVACEAGNDGGDVFPVAMRAGHAQCTLDQASGDVTIVYAISAPPDCPQLWRRLLVDQALVRRGWSVDALGAAVLTQRTASSGQGTESDVAAAVGVADGSARALYRALLPVA